MGPTLLCELGLFLLCTLLCTGHARDAVLTIEPNWSSFFIGEFVTFMCDMNEGADTDWEYKLNKDGREFVLYNKNKGSRLQITYRVYSGEYQCSGSRKSSNYTKNSNTVSVTVSADKPRATLTAGTTIIPVGGSVTLTCSVGRSAEWKYEWFRRTQRTTEVQIRRDDQPNRVIRVSQGGIYRCRGRRGDPVFYTDISDEVSIEITFSNKVAVKQQQHNWPQIFSGETITLTCEVQEGGEPTEWEYEWRGPRQTTQWTHNNSLTFRVSESSSGDYMCKSRRRDDSYSSTEWSEAFTLSVTKNQPKAELSADIRDIPVGGSVTLSCSVNPSSSSGWKYYWYRDEKHSEPLTTQDAVFLSNGQISVSQEGLYRCRGGRGDPVYYTEDSQSVRINKAAPADKPQASLRGSVTLTCSVDGSAGWRYYWFRRTSESSAAQRLKDGTSSHTFSISEGGIYHCRGGRGDPLFLTEDSAAVTIETNGFRGEGWSFLVPFMVGLVCGSSLIVAVLLCCMCCRTRIKDPCSHSFMQSPNINRGSATPQTADQSETQVYSSLLHGDLCVYESVRNSGNTQSGGAAGECSNAASTIQLDDRRRHDAAEESSDYNNVNPESASGP